MDTMSTLEISLQQFRNFFFAKAFDIIGNHSFKRHLARCKDVNDEWAVIICNDVQIMHNVIKQIQALVTEIPVTPCRIHEICKDVMSNAQPPVKIYAGTAICSLTHVTCSQCIDLTKIHKRAENTYVDSRFSNFFLFLWFINKIEYVIRSYVRAWLDKQPTGQNNATLCQSIQDDMQNKTEDLHQLFLLAYQHVHQSLESLINVQLKRVIISETHSKKRKEQA